VVSFKPRSLHLQRKSPLYPLDRRLVSPRTGRRKILPLLGLELRLLGRSARSLSLYQVRYRTNKVLKEREEGRSKRKEETEIKNTVYVPVSFPFSAKNVISYYNSFVALFALDVFSAYG
jgi:hypothetical protein